MVYLSSFYYGTTVKISIPVATLFPSVTIEDWDKCNVVLAKTKGGTKSINTYDVSFANSGVANIELNNNTQTKIDVGFYFYEIYFQHSDDSDVSQWEEEYVIESGRLQVKERV